MKVYLASGNRQSEIAKMKVYSPPFTFPPNFPSQFSTCPVLREQKSKKSELVDFIKYQQLFGSQSVPGASSTESGLTWATAPKSKEKTAWPPILPRKGRLHYYENLAPEIKCLAQWAIEKAATWRFCAEVERRDGAITNLPNIKIPKKGAA